MVIDICAGETEEPGVFEGTLLDGCVKDWVEVIVPAGNVPLLVWVTAWLMLTEGVA